MTLAFLRVPACLLLLAIGGDLGADGRCDEGLTPPPVSAAALLGETPASPDGQEACASFCVPDCFCCSASVPAAAPVEPAEPRLRAASFVLRAERWSTGVLPLVDRPPLRLA